jgi:hypothetical protein
MNRDQPHPSDEALLRKIDDELSPAPSDTLDAHLSVCERCRNRLLIIRTSAGAASLISRSGVVVSEPALDDLRSRLRSNLARRSAELDRSWRFQVARRMGKVPAVGLAAAALALLAVGGAFIRFAMDEKRPIAVGLVEAGALPIAALTPGATERVTADELCAGRGPSREPIALAVRQAVLRDYRLEGLPEAEYELDYLITPELGGSSDRRNLWPERYGSRVWNARVKDQLELLLPQMVCEGRLDLATAQRDIATDWIAAYRKYFNTQTPLPAQIAALAGDGPEAPGRWTRLR